MNIAGTSKETLRASLATPRPPRPTPAADRTAGTPLGGGSAALLPAETCARPHDSQCCCRRCCAETFPKRKRWGPLCRCPRLILPPPRTVLGTPHRNVSLSAPAKDSSCPLKRLADQHARGGSAWENLLFRCELNACPLFKEPQDALVAPEWTPWTLGAQTGHCSPLLDTADGHGAPAQPLQTASGRRSK